MIMMIRMMISGDDGDGYDEDDGYDNDNDDDDEHSYDER